MTIRRLHHVAYRCKDAQETTDFYTKILGLKYAMALSEDKVPSTGEHSPYMHVFFQMDDGSSVAFFEVPESPPMQFDSNTPPWVQHLALDVDSMETLEDMKRRIQDAGVEVIGPIDHNICQSIYFFDPNGHRLELAYDTTSAEMAEKLAGIAEPMLKDWNKSKTTQDHTDFVHTQLRDKT
ncbi:MAG: VOC family protein [Rhodospirillales bacterium]|nr:VOC family protein [Rhodospirillales bacterium]